MVARCWGVSAFSLHASTGNRTRATIKALPASPHRPRPTDVDELFLRLMPIGGGVRKGKKDTGYLYKAFMIARLALSP
jgi:hypothetical protein